MGIKMENKNNIKSLQLICLEILKEIDRVCEKHNILYWLDSGSMLGAVRHNGFIPWDDDLDIKMYRDDYEKFLAVAPQELKKQYFLQTHQTDSEYPLFFAKVRKNNTFIDEKRYRRLKIHKGIYVDIFPVDKLGSNIKVAKKHCRKLRVFYFFYLLLERKVDTNTTDKYYLFFKIIRFFFIPLSFFKERFRKIFEKGLIKYNSTTDSRFIGSVSVLQSGKSIYEKEWFSGFFKHQFEDMEANIPIGYDEFLKSQYGDYMKLPPKEKQIPEHGLSFSTDVEGEQNE